MRHWQGLIPKENRTACGKRSFYPIDISSFDEVMFGELIKKNYSYLCSECVRQYRIEQNRPPGYILISKTKCGYVGFMYRVKSESQCRKFAKPGTNPPRCQSHIGK